MFAMVPHSRDSQWSYHTHRPWNPHCTTLDSDTGKTICVCVCCFILFLVLNIAAGLLNKEKRGWIPRGQVLYTHWKAMLFSSEYMMMERRMVLSKQDIQDISVDHGKLLHNQNWWEESRQVTLKKIFFNFKS